MNSSFFQKSLIGFVKSEALRVARENEGKKMTSKKLLEEIIPRAGYKYAKERLNSPNKGLVNKESFDKLNLFRRKRTK